MDHVFVTGGSGYVGRNLIRALRERGSRVVALARSGASAQIVTDLGAEPVRGDLDAVEAMAAGMKDCTVVFHAAAKVALWGDQAEFVRINVEGTRNAIEAARKAGVPRFVIVSTEAVLTGKRPLVNVNESFPYPKKPIGLYSTTKAEAERLVLAANGDGLETVAVRPPLVWGRDDTSVLPEIERAVADGQWVWFGGGHYPHSTTHVANAVKGLLLAAEKGRDGEVYFVSDGAPHDFREFITAMLAARGVDPGKKKVPFWMADLIARTGEGMWKGLRLGGAPPLPRAVLYVLGREVTVDDSKAREELGYEGRVSVEAGLAELRTK